MSLSWKERVSLNWKFAAGFLIPLVLIPLLLMKDDDIVEGTERKATKYKCLYVIILIALYWMLEIIPLAVTSLLPVVFFPLLGVMDTSLVSTAYMKETNMMFLGGLIIALAVEYSNLHRRIALKVLLFVGTSPIRLMFGVMLTSMFLSMWMSNTACTAMMVPIVLAVLEELAKTPDLTKSRRISQHASRKQSVISVSLAATDGDNAVIVEHDSDAIKEEESKERRKYRINTKRMLLFATAYAANIGGSGVITGTGSNLVFQGKIKDVDVDQDGKYTDITFATWIGFNIFPMLVNVLIAWIYLVFKYFGIPNWRDWPLVSLCAKKDQNTMEAKMDKAKSDAVYDVLFKEYQRLGSLTFHEFGVGVLFVFVVLMWLCREPGFVDGWNSLIPGIDNGDSTAAMLGIFLMFLVPKDLSFLFGNPTKGASNGALLDWPFVQRKLSWGTILLLGGGFALSDAADYSGLSMWLGTQLNSLENLPNEAILIIVMLLTALITEVASNVACANVIIPILITLSKSLKLHPLYLTMAATICCSYAFMLPVATPPNAIVFAAGDMKVMDMVKTGAVLNVSCIFIFFIFNITYGNAFFNYDNYEWPNATTPVIG